MPAKILIVTADGKIVNLFANGDAEVYLREMSDGPAAARQVETTVRTTADFDALVAPRPGGRWDLPGQKESDETKPDSEGLSKTDYRRTAGRRSAIA